MTPLDLDDIESRIKDGIEDLDGPSYSGIADDAFSALAEIIAEVTRLREEVERLRGHRESCTGNLQKGYETGKAEERAAVVAWLREVAEKMQDADEGSYFWIAVGLVHDIERGEHRREGGE